VNEPVLLKEWLSEEARSLAESYFRIVLAAGRLTPEPGMKSDALYGDPLADALAIRGTSIVSDNAGRSVYPSYGYWRVYWPGASLELHRDREACDWTMSVAVASQSNTLPWPLEVGSGPTTTINLAPGDAVLLRGRELAHGRLTPAPGWSAWLFLHWVEDRGSYLDGRPLPAFGRGTS